jgi:hypothetical protein
MTTVNGSAGGLGAARSRVSRTRTGRLLAALLASTALSAVAGAIPARAQNATWLACLASEPVPLMTPL